MAKVKQNVRTETVQETVQTAQQPTQGVVLLALNHPYYGNYAAQLAASILFSAPQTKITLLHDGKAITHLTEKRLSLFDKIIKLDPSYYTLKGRYEYLKPKAYMYELSPYDTTIFLDADMLWLPRRPITQIFDLLKDVDFTMANRGCIDISKAKANFITWCNPAEIIEKYNAFGMIYNLSSEFFYFKKTQEVEEFFKCTQQIFDDIKVNHLQFGTGIPDELPFTIAMLQTGIYPHTTPWLPSYWQQYRNERLTPNDMYNMYYVYSCGGAMQSDAVKRFYNNLAQFYCNKSGLGHHFPLHSKRQFLPERINI